MNKHINIKWVLTFISIFIVHVFFQKTSQAEIEISDIQPNWGQSNKTFDFRITGKGFTEKTRLSISYDVSNQNDILGALTINGQVSRVAQINDTYIAIADNLNCRLMIIDISTTHSPKLTGEIDLPGNPGEINTLIVVEKKVFVAHGSAGIHIVDISDPSEPVLKTKNLTGFVFDLNYSNPYLYVACGSKGIKIFKVNDMYNLDLIGQKNITGDVNAIAIFEKYIICSDYYEGIQILSTQDLSNVSMISSLPINGTIHAIKIAGNYAFLAADTSGLIVVNISDPKNPVILSETRTPGKALDIDIQGNTVCIADYNCGLSVLNIAKLEQPNLIGNIDTPDIASGIIANGKIAYIADGDSGLQVIKFTDPENQVIGSYSLDGNTTAIQLLDSTAYALSNKGLYLIDVSDPKLLLSQKKIQCNNINSFVIKDQFIYIAQGNYFKILNKSSSFDSGSPDVLGQLLENDVVKDIEIKDHIAYLACFGKGLKIIDISSPTKPTEIKSLETPGYAVGLALNQNHIFIATFEGVYIVDISTPDDPNPVATIHSSGVTLDLTIDRNYLFCANGSSGLYIHDIKNIEAPKKVSQLPMNSAAKVVIYEKTAFVADREGGMHMVDIYDPHNPEIIGTIKTPGPAVDMAINDSLAFIADESTGILVEPIPLELDQYQLITDEIIDASIPSLNHSGHFTVRVFQADKSDEASGAITLSDNMPNVKAILVAGRMSDKDPLWRKATQLCIKTAYNALLF